MLSPSALFSTAQPVAMVDVDSNRNANPAIRAGETQVVDSIQDACALPGGAIVNS